MSEPSVEAAAAAIASEERPGGATATLEPAPPEEYIQAAKLAPDHWLYYIDPTWSGEGPPPEWAVVGQWRSDLDGEIVEWQDNEEYKPSPAAHGWPEPEDPVDAAIQLATTGYGPAEDVTRALAAAEVAVLVTGDGGLVHASAPDGTVVVPAFSAPTHLHRYGNLAYELVKIPDLLDRLPDGQSLYVNPSAAVGMVVETQSLLEAIAEAEIEAAASGEEDGAEASAEDETAPPARPVTESRTFTAESPNGSASSNGTAGLNGTASSNGSAGSNGKGRIDDLDLPDFDAGEPGDEPGGASAGAN